MTDKLLVERIVKISVQEEDINEAVFMWLRLKGEAYKLPSQNRNAYNI